TTPPPRPWPPDGPSWPRRRGPSCAGARWRPACRPWRPPAPPCSPSPPRRCAPAAPSPAPPKPPWGLASRAGLGRRGHLGLGHHRQVRRVRHRLLLRLLLGQAAAALDDRVRDAGGDEPHRADGVV